MLHRFRSQVIVWFALFCTGALPLLFPAPFGALAQSGHIHSWQAAPSYAAPYPYLAGAMQPRTGQFVPLYAYFGSAGQDYDQCTGNTDYYQGIFCSFGSYMTAQASNNLFVVEWSASRSGGKFGWFNGSNQFVEKGANDAWTQVTHYQTPGTTGDVTLTVSVEDNPQATDPATQQVIQTAFDGRKSGSATITVTTDPMKATWAPHTAISGAALSLPAEGTVVQTGQNVSCSAAAATDADKRDPPQQMYYGMPGQTEYPDDTVSYTWTATGGTFLNPNAQSTSWSCTTIGNYTLTLRVDDQNDANKPSGDNGTRDDAAVVFTRTVQVSAPATIWNTYSAINSGISLPASDLTVALGAAVPLEALAATDVDQRVANAGTTTESDTCSYTWSATGGGSFANTNQRTTTWTAPNSAGSFTLTLRVDDLNDTNKPAGELGTRNDAQQTYTRTVHVYNATWAADSGISGVTLTAPTAGVSVARGGQIACSAAAGAADNDRRTPLGGTATTEADTVQYTWLATGGSFAGGVNTGLNVTWTAPTQSGSYTLTLRVDDANDANKPSDEGGTRNDPAVDRTVNVMVKAPVWTPSSGIDSAGITQPSTAMITVDPHQSVLCSTPPATDQDRRTDESGAGTFYDDVCSYAWSGTGGSFTAPTNRDTNWTAPADAGTYTLTLKVADAAVKNPEGEGTRDDPDRTFTVTVKVRHFHQWSTPPAITPYYFYTSDSRPLPGQTVLINRYGEATDTDTCSVAGCSFPEGHAENDVHPSQWLASSGSFGYYNGTTWVSSTNVALITHWKAPANPGWVTLTLRTEDTPTATDPETNQSVTTADDNAAETTWRIKVVSHDHTWTNGDPITAPPPGVSQAFPLAGEVVQFTAQPGTDHDTCTASGCSFSGGIAPNNTYPATWSCTAGEFVQLDPVTNTYQPYFGGNPPSGANVSWRAPASIPYGGLNVTITLAVEDVAAAHDTEYEADVRTADDSPALVVAAIKVVRHQHQWEAVSNLSAGTINVDTETPTAGQTIQLNGGYGYYGYDSDRCTASSCSFSGGYAYNSTHIASWEAKAGGADVGAFGWLNGSGQFVAKQTADPWTQVTHWKTPSTVPAGGLSVTLTRKSDDTPEATDPELNVVVPTYDDTPASASKTLTVTRHQHAWGTFFDPEIPQPYFSVSSYNPAAGGLVQLTKTIASPDYDTCYDYRNTCPFPGDQAQNEVRISGWDDDGAGGKFGKLVGTQFVERAANESWDTVTHYRCPNAGGYVTLTLTVDDVWQGILEPVTGDAINTNDDDPVSADQWLQVQPPHQHEWSSTGNTALLPVYLRDHGVNLTAACTGDVLELVKGDWTVDHDRCANTDGRCPFPNGDAAEDLTKHKVVRFADDAGGMFGKLSADGTEFIQTSAVSEITHYVVPEQLPAGGHLEVWAVIDDAGLAKDTGDNEHTTINDPEKEGTHYSLTPSDCLVNIPTRRRLADEDACGCPTCSGGVFKLAPAYSNIDPESGAVSFQVPVSSWSYRGTQLGLTFSYNSGSRADPSLDSPDWPGVNAQPDLSRLSVRNSRWTHNWAQFMEVVEDSGGELHALWHNGGGAVGFLGNSMGTWTSGDDVHTLTSGGTSTKQMTIRRTVMSAGINHASNPVACGGEAPAQQRLRMVKVFTPYSWFEVRDASGSTYRFDQVYWEVGKANGGVAIPHFPLTRITDRYGRVVNLTWSEGKLQSVIDGDGHGLSFTYAGGLLVNVRDMYNRTHTLGYTDVADQWGHNWRKLTAVNAVGPGNPSVNYQWGFEYGPAGTHSGYYSGTYTGDLVVRKQEPTGKVVSYTYEGVNVNRTGYQDWDGRVLRAEYYDAAEGRTKVISRAGSTLMYPGGRTVTYSYDGHDLASVRENATGRETRYTYDALHRLLTVRTNAEPEGTPALTTLEYTTGPDNRTVTHVKSTDRLGRVTETDLGAFQLPTRTTVRRSAPLSDLVSQIAYSALGNPVTVTALVGHPLEQTSTLGYTSAAAPDSSTVAADSLGRAWTSTLDGAGRVLATTSPENLVAPLGHPDRAPSVSTVQYTPDGLPVLMRDALNREVQLSYRGLSGGKLEVTSTRMVDGATSLTVMNAAGQVISATDASGVRSDMFYNGDDDLVWMTEAANRPGSRTTRYEYNLYGDLAAIIPPKGELGRVSFDYRRYSQTGILDGTYEGQTTRITHPDGTEEYFGYDSAGALAWESRPYSAAGTVQWSTITYEYDTAHRPLRVNYPSSPDGTGGYTVETEYDDLDRVRRVTDATGATTYTYDDLSRVTQISPSGGRKAVTMAYVPDTGLKRWITRTTLAGVGTWEEREDTKGRFSGTINPFGQAFNLEYNAAGQPIRRHQANNTRTEYGYLPTGQLGTLALYLADNTVLDQLTYTYDVDGRLLTETDAGSRVHSYIYDVLGQLIDEQHPDLGPTGTQYHYDANGNRTQVVRGGLTEWYGVDNADKLLWTNTTATGLPSPGAPTAGQAGGYSLYGYDAFGQTVARDRRSRDGQRHAFDFRWDADGRLREVRENGAIALSAQYAPDGERITKSDTAGNHVNSFRLHDSAGTGATYTPGFAERKGSQDRFTGADHLGSTRYLTDGSGAATPAALRYDAYGLRSAGGGTDPAHPTDHQYAGAWGYQREEAPGLGLDYLYQRYYDAEAGRFISRDPIGWDGGLNLYQYVGNDPVNQIDADGTQARLVRMPPMGNNRLRANNRGVGPTGRSAVFGAPPGLQAVVERRIRDTQIQWSLRQQMRYRRQIAHDGVARDRALHEIYKRDLRRQMERPFCTDPKLNEHIGKLYRANAIVGSGSTADAIRFERATGLPVGGLRHPKKGADSIIFLEKWLQANSNNPKTAQRDIAAAQNVLADLKDALFGR